MRIFRKLKVPDRVHPLVKTLFREMNRQYIGILDMSERSGVNRNTINDWKRRSIPSIHNLEACFNVLGLTLKPTARRLVVAPTTELPPTSSVNPTEMESAGT